jgi:hypothetical protein
VYEFTGRKMKSTALGIGFISVYSELSVVKRLFVLAPAAQTPSAVNDYSAGK